MNQALLTAVALAILAASANAQTPARPAPATEAPKAADPVAKLTEWPALKKEVDRRARAATKQFRKKDAELHQKARQQLIGLGPGVAPILIPMVNDRGSGNINEHLFAVLDELTNARHASLLAREIKRPSVELRRYLMRRLGSFHDVDMGPVMRKGLKDKDPEIAYQAALGLLGIHDKAGLPLVLTAARKSWSEQREQIARVLKPAQSAKFATVVFGDIAKRRATEQMAGLRLLRFLMTKQQAVMLRHYLQSSDFAVKREAINVARVLHGEKPLEKLASFQAINMAKQWLEKL